MQQLAESMDGRVVVQVVLLTPVANGVCDCALLVVAIIRAGT